ncbi:hypothetical protein BD779DRAFT_1533243 [Infundibulicybe gibba]|nr:hypothetical protein BD779DRAFT_1533243 [Infundibulicybe gibba]
MMSERIPILLDTIRAGYTELGRLVHIALRTQQGDAARLGERRVDCLHLLQLAQQHPKLQPPVVQLDKFSLIYVLFILIRNFEVSIQKFESLD